MLNEAININLNCHSLTSPPALACGIFCTKALSRDAPPTHRAVPIEMLRSALTQLTSDWARSSFTRRSAGLPGLICKMVAAEPGGRPRTLLPLALDTLLECADAKVDPNLADQDDTEDCTSSHALHVLRSLVQDAVIAKDLDPQIACIAKVCLSSFDSPSWAVRNAALQLFGALALRVVGQVKVRDEEGQVFNRVELTQVEARLPGLLQLLLDRVVKDIGAQGTPDDNLKNERSKSNIQGQLVDPALLPILTILARIESRPSCKVAPTLASAVSKHSDSPVARVSILEKFTKVRL